MNRHHVTCYRQNLNLPFKTICWSNIKCVEFATAKIRSAVFKFWRVQKGYVTVCCLQWWYTYQRLTGPIINSFDLALLQNHILGINPTCSEVIFVITSLNGQAALTSWIWTISSYDWCILSCWLCTFHLCYCIQIVFKVYVCFSPVHS